MARSVAGVAATTTEATPLVSFADHDQQQPQRQRQHQGINNVWVGLDWTELN